MPSAIVLFRPTGPWRFGPDSGVRDRVDLIYHSDSLYAAVTSAMLRLDFLEDWLDATARRENVEPEVRFSSLFPFQRDLLYVTPPRSMWPPPPSTKIRFKSARFVPLTVVQLLVAERPIDENRWIIDAESQCMIPSGEGPFRIGLRSAAAIDRMDPAAIGPHTTACIEFTRDAGLWTMVVFSSDSARERWQPRVRSALRLLADSGFGGERSRGWGRCLEPEWQECPELWPAPEVEKAYWLLSLYAPAGSDAVDWKTGNYSTVTRTGRIESAADWGGLKAPSLMIAEGSVLVAAFAPRGETRNVAPPDFAHAVYRAGFAVTMPIPWKVPGPQRPPAAQVSRPVQPPSEPTPEPEPVVPAPESPPAVPTPEPEPAVAAPQPEPVAPTPEPPTVAPTPEPEPAVAATEPEPVAPTPEQPAVVPTPEPEPAVPAPQGEPVAPTPEPPPVVPTPEGEPAVPSPQPELVAPTPEPPPVVPTPEPEPILPVPEPKAVGTLEPEPPLVPTLEPEPVLSTPAAKPGAPTPEPEPTVVAPEPEAVASTPEPLPVAPTPEPEPAVPAPQPEPVPPVPEPEPPDRTPQPELPAPEAEPESATPNTGQETCATEPTDTPGGKP